MAETKSSMKKPPKSASKEGGSSSDKASPATKSKRGWDEIESLFDDSKKKKKAAAAVETSKKKKHNNNKPKSEHQSTRLQTSDMGGGDWVDDGLGGVYNSEGFTGRVEEGVRVFKAHIIQQSPDAGNTELCPFD